MYYRHDHPFLLLREVDTLRRQQRQPHQPERTIEPIQEYHRLVFLNGVYDQVWRNVHPMDNRRMALFFVYDGRFVGCPYHPYSKDLGVNLREQYFTLLVELRQWNVECHDPILYYTDNDIPYYTYISTWNPRVYPFPVYLKCVMFLMGIMFLTILLLVVLFNPIEPLNS